MQAVRLVPAVHVGAGQAAKRRELVPCTGGQEAKETALGRELIQPLVPYAFIHYPLAASHSEISAMTRSGCGAVE